MKIAIVGGGIGGLATALAMTKAGLAVTVHERSEQLVDQGAGITLGPNATRVLYHLDIGRVFVTAGVTFDAAFVREELTVTGVGPIAHTPLFEAGPILGFGVNL